MRRVVALAGLAAGALVTIRPGVAVRVLRSIDRRAGIFSTHGATLYAHGSGLVRGLHRRVATDAAASVAGDEATIVDVGSGPGDLIAELRARAPAAQLTGVEPSAEMRDIAARRGVASIAGRAEALPFPDHSVDLVLSTLSSHHWDDPGAAFSEIRRVLRPGGEGRIYDFRLLGYGRDEAFRVADGAGIGRDRIRREVLDERLLGLRPYALITIRA